MEVSYILIAKARGFTTRWIIMLHNHFHPSGSCSPSSNDIIVTKHIKESCDILEIKLLDHIIIGADQRYSFREKTDILFEDSRFTSLQESFSRSLQKDYTQDNCPDYEY